MQVPEGLARFNKRVTNPIQRVFAGWAPGYAVIEHVGRPCGKPYQTPIKTE